MSLSATIMKQDHVQKRSARRHALVIGASAAGLLAARVLSDYFEYVTIIERDTLPAYMQTRKGVPQGEHIHLLMGKGAQIIDGLFPSLFSALEKDGALLLSPTDDFHWFHFGSWKLQFPGSLRLHSQSRPLLEYHIHRCVAGIPNVYLLDNCTALGLIAGQDSSVDGVGARRRYGQREEIIEANLVVDASGRGSQVPAWLATMGYPAVEETLVKIDVGYVTRIYRRKEHIPRKAPGIYPWPLDKKRIGYLFPIERGAWVVTLSGYLRDYPPLDEAGLLAFASTLARPNIFEAIKDAEPLSAIAVHKFPANRWRHYERFSHIPDGLIVLGDAACSFNPVYGQGMTVATLEARALRDCLERHVTSHNSSLAGFSARFQKALASVVRIPWMFATSEDFRYAATEGKRPFGIGMLQEYTQRVCNLTATDPFATLSFYEVRNMLKPPVALFHPRILFPALFAHPGNAVVMTDEDCAGCNKINA